MKDSNGGTVFMVGTWPQAGSHPDWGKKWQKEKSKEMAKLEVCKVFWGRQDVWFSRRRRTRSGPDNTWVYKPVGSPG